jgi:hypothetical protein
MEKVELIYTAVAFVAGWVLERPALVKSILAKVVKKKKA